LKIGNEKLGMKNRKEFFLSFVITSFQDSLFGVWWRMRLVFGVWRMLHATTRHYTPLHATTRYYGIAVLCFKISIWL
jgi:hypothetical protein